MSKPLGVLQSHTAGAKAATRETEIVSGAPGETRTPDPLLRRQTLYPTELRAHGAIYFIIKGLEPVLEKRQFQISVQTKC